MLFVPWVLCADHDVVKGEFKVRGILYLGCCAPLAWVVGVGVAVVYYARKVGRYGGFERRMRRRAGGKGYWIDLKDVEGEGGGKGDAVVVAGGDGDGTKVGIGGRDVGEQGTRWTGTTLVDEGRGTISRSGEDLGRVEGMQRPEVVGSRPGHAFAKMTASNLWKIKNRFQSGYEGWETRRTAWQAEEIEMNEFSKR
ncbi:hypothetical protein IAQ61_007250 [Plenodomus lingam]|uniref:uncharacterized protein n=1 Tax=Leptosphaeria maculans TaxID=5022 RepID=UPI00331D78FB|nr:hypothetical protein IAQ61_007250 [Plenodomus lingam]